MVSNQNFLSRQDAKEEESAKAEKSIFASVPNTRLEN